MRLTDGLTQYEGRVEVYLNLEWITICNDGWDEADAKVVCRQLNYLSTSVDVQGYKIILVQGCINFVAMVKKYHSL